MTYSAGIGGYCFKHETYHSDGCGKCRAEEPRITDHTPATETHAGDWERGYAKGYDRALCHVLLLGCDCFDGSCKACELVDRLRGLDRDDTDA